MCAERPGDLAYTYNPKRLKQADCHEIEEIEGSLGYKADSGLAWATE